MNDQDKIKSINDDIKPDKVKALAENIIAECKQQGFTIEEVDFLIAHLQSILGARLVVANQELF